MIFFEGGVVCLKDTYSSKSLITTLKVFKRSVGSQEQCFEFHFSKRNPSEREGGTHKSMRYF